MLPQSFESRERFEKGKYDLVLTWKLEKHPERDNWIWSPDGELWWEALVVQEGSEHAAQKVVEQYSQLVASTVTNVARKAR